MIGLHNTWALALALPAVAWLVVLRSGIASGIAALPGQWPQVIDVPLQRLLARQLPPARRDWQRLLAFGCWLLLVAAIARPFIQTEGLAPIANMAGRVLVIDLGGDAVLSEQKLAATELLKRGDIPTAIVAATNDAYTAVPLTQDRQQIERYMRVLDPELMPTGGQSLALGIAHAENMLTASGVIAGQVIVLTGGTAPAATPESPAARFLRGVVPSDGGLETWADTADALGADLAGPSDIGTLNDALDSKIAERRNEQMGEDQIELSIWFLLAGMILWLGLFRREESQ